MEIKELWAKDISYGGSRSLKDVKYIVIHYTAGNGDSAHAEASYFHSGNTRAAGAHFFVDKKGIVYQSIKMSRIAYSVGGFFTKRKGAGTYYQVCTNSNSVSIEMCDAIKGTNWEQMCAMYHLVRHIRKSCPNAKKIIRHWDVNGKDCPGSMCGTKNKQWKHLHNFLEHKYQYKAKVKVAAAIRTGRKIDKANRIGTLEKGRTVEVKRVVGNWCMVEIGGHDRWVAKSKLKEI